ncbi:hypothetical protein V6N11_026024 [Hibiscus sabdariffa]|uniref:Uncharacterized protein n=1 Tax=Hibiscus sabdariffa TaxID=183260 RepID=A0ABR2SUF7_9ROSI
MTNSDEINTLTEAVVNNFHGTADVNVANPTITNTVFASSPVYYASSPHAMALPQGFNSAISPSAHSVVQCNRQLSSPLYTQLPAQYVTSFAQHPVMMQSTPTGTAQAMCK